MSWIDLLLILACVILVALPTKWDPAIWLKEWNIRKSKRHD